MSMSILLQERIPQHRNFSTASTSFLTAKKTIIDRLPSTSCLKNPSIRHLLQPRPSSGLYQQSDYPPPYPHLLDPKAHQPEPSPLPLPLPMSLQKLLSASREMLGHDLHEIYGPHIVQPSATPEGWTSKPIRITRNTLLGEGQSVKRSTKRKKRFAVKGIRLSSQSRTASPLVQTQTQTPIPQPSSEAQSVVKARPTTCVQTQAERPQTPEVSRGWMQLSRCRTAGQRQRNVVPTLHRTTKGTASRGQEDHKGQPSQQDKKGQKGQKGRRGSEVSRGAESVLISCMSYATNTTQGCYQTHSHNISGHFFGRAQIRPLTVIQTRYNEQSKTVAKEKENLLPSSVLRVTPAKFAEKVEHSRQQLVELTALKYSPLLHYKAERKHGRGCRSSNLQNRHSMNDWAYGQASGAAGAILHSENRRTRFKERRGPQGDPDSSSPLKAWSREDSPQHQQLLLSPLNQLDA